MPTHTWSSLAAGLIDEATTAHLGEIGQQVARAARLGGEPLRSPVQQDEELVGGHTHEGVHVQLLIGSVKLGQGGEHAWVF